MIRWLSVSVWGLALSIMLGVMFGAGGYTFYYAEGASYLSNNPASCANCGVMNDPYDSWQKASHHTVATCNDCYMPHDLVGKYPAKAENVVLHPKAIKPEDLS